MEVWRAIPDVFGRRLRFALPAEEGGCAPLLATKYEPNVIKTDRVIEDGKWQFFKCLRKVPCW